MDDKKVSGLWMISRPAFWGWIGGFVGLPLVAFAAGSWQMLYGDGCGHMLAHGKDEGACPLTGVLQGL
jgi:hypothetical protein